MILIINSATPQESRVLLVIGDTVSKKSILSRDGKRGDVLAVIDALLRARKVKIESLKGVVVVTGPGHFSYLRTGISIANTIGLALNIPVAGLTTDEFSSDAELIEKGQAKLKKINKFKSIVPAYGKEPNITQSRKL